MFKPLGQPRSIPGLATPESQETANASHIATPDACERRWARGVLEVLKLALSVTPQSQSYFCDCNDVGRGQPGVTQPQHPFPAASGDKEEPDPHLLRQGSRKRRLSARSSTGFIALQKVQPSFMELFKDKPEHSGAGLRPSPALPSRACTPPVTASLSLLDGQPARATTAVPTTTTSCQHKGLTVTSRIPVTCEGGSSGRADSPLDTAFRHNSRWCLFLVRHKSLKLPQLT